MNYELIDIKLKNYIEICKQTGNYKNLTALSFVLLGNVLNEIGVKLGIRPLNKASREPLFQYMKLINSVLYDNFKFFLFKEDDIVSVQTAELSFNKSGSAIPMKFISEMYKLFYELRELEIPNVFEKVDVEAIIQNKEINSYSFLSGVQEYSKKSNSEKKLKQVIANRFKEKQFELQKDLNDEYEEKKFEELLNLKNAEVAFKRHESGKIVIQGRLKDNLSYQRSIPHIYEYMNIGFMLICFLLGLAIVIQTIYHPELTVQTSILTLIFFSTGCLLLILYRQNFKK